VPRAVAKDIMDYYYLPLGKYHCIVLAASFEHRRQVDLSISIPVDWWIVRLFLVSYWISWKINIFRNNKNKINHLASS
jgi:hypothetical protein